jgi:hypothetical protein
MGKLANGSPTVNLLLAEMSFHARTHFLTLHRRQSAHHVWNRYILAFLSRLSRSAQTAALRTAGDSSGLLALPVPPLHGLRAAAVCHRQDGASMAERRCPVPDAALLHLPSVLRAADGGGLVWSSRGTVLRRLQGGSWLQLVDDDVELFA